MKDFNAEKEMYTYINNNILSVDKIPANFIWVNVFEYPPQKKVVYIIAGSDTIHAGELVKHEGGKAWKLITGEIEPLEKYPFWTDLPKPGKEFKDPTTYLRTK
jgi:hypothetical protein